MRISRVWPLSWRLPGVPISVISVPAASVQTASIPLILGLCAALMVTGCSPDGQGHTGPVETGPVETGPAETEPVESRQVAAPDLAPEVPDPRWPGGDGPLVVIDEAHHNFHTLGDRYAAFGELLRRDGFRVEEFPHSPTAESLQRVDVLVISNAQRPEEAQRSEEAQRAEEEFRVLPTKSAFLDAEIETLTSWVEDGGSLLLIADHMPLAGAAADLAERFGVLLTNGYTYGSTDKGPDVFSLEGGGLRDHEIVRGAAGRSVERVATFRGNAFQVRDVSEDERLGPWEPLLVFGSEAYTLLPIEWGVLEEDTPRLKTPGWHHGGVRTVGEGRVAIFGEAAMFTAQRNGENLMGMGHDEASENPRFVRNLLYWLAES